VIAPPPSQNPTQLRPVALATALLAPLLLAGCSGAVEVAAPDLDAADRAACEALVDDLPDELFGQERRDVSPDSGVTAAWGDPAVVLTCGAEEPDDFGPFARCSEIDGVGWFMADSELGDTSRSITIAAQSHSPLVTVVVPPEHRRTAPDTALGELSAPVVEHLDETSPCH